ncbi:hypothetical protein [Sinorhizobium meliloti]|uniref:hypothetical protein n=1 Tax=Rhizobium meliloti TaxID=382 RepID=UPI001F2EB219|nr:hypothetical protein [Sinorhizobium meliloti]
MGGRDHFGIRGRIASEFARVNLSTRRVSIVWKEEVAGKRSDPGELVRAISERGHETHIFTHGEGEGDAVGEPISVSSGDAVEAGTLNLTGPLVLRATANARNSFLAEIMGLMEAAEGGRALSWCHPPRG